MATRARPIATRSIGVVAATAAAPARTSRAGRHKAMSLHRVINLRERGPLAMGRAKAQELERDVGARPGMGLHGRPAWWLQRCERRRTAPKWSHQFAPRQRP